MKSEKTVLLLLLSLIINSLSAESVSEKRSFMKSFPAHKGGKLEVINKYGDVNISNWSKDSVYIRAEIEAFAPSESRLTKMFDGISTDFTEAGSIIRAKTDFDQSISALLEGFKGLTQKLIDYESRVKISYFIKAPDYLDISVENQFGDISMENNRGNVSVNVSNGDFKATSLNSKLDLTVNFGDVEIDYLSSGKITSTFSKAEIKECGDISINSTSSRYDIRKGGRLTVESRRDKIYGGGLSELAGVSYFTDFKFETLSGSIDLDLKYGSLDIETAESRFDKINLNSVFSDITIGFNPSSSYDFEIRHTNSFVVIPEKNTRSEKEELNDNKKEYLITGTFGSNPGSRKVEIEATRGNIYLR